MHKHDVHLENPWLQLTPDIKGDDPIESTDLGDPMWASSTGKCKTGHVDKDGHKIHPWIKFKSPVHSVHVTLEDKHVPDKPVKMWDAYFEGERGDPGNVSKLNATGIPHAGPKRTFSDFCPPFTKESRYSLCVTDTDKQTFEACYTLAPVNHAPSRHRVRGSRHADALGTEDKDRALPRAPLLSGSTDGSRITEE